MINVYTTRLDGDTGTLFVTSKTPSINVFFACTQFLSNRTTLNLRGNYKWRQSNWGEGDLTLFKLKGCLDMTKGSKFEWRHLWLAPFYFSSKMGGLPNLLLLSLSVDVVHRCRRDGVVIVRADRVFSSGQLPFGREEVAGIEIGFEVGPVHWSCQLEQVRAQAVTLPGWSY